MLIAGKFHDLVLECDAGLELRRELLLGALLGADVFDLGIFIHVTHAVWHVLKSYVC